MSDQTADRSSQQEGETQSLAELFHLVKTLIPEGQRPETAERDWTVSKALNMMRQKYYSQLPVVSGDAVLGVFSYRSLAVRLLEIGELGEDFADLPVEEFMEDFVYVQPSENWETILPHLDRDDGVLIGHRDGLEGILTATDVLNYLHDIARPFVALAEIELSLRRLIRACVDDQALQACIRNSLSDKYGEEALPTSLEDMTLNDYAQIICHGLNWAHFGLAFGSTEFQRKDAQHRLSEVRDLRNVVFHFRRRLTEAEEGAIARHRQWIELKSRAFEGQRRKLPTQPGAKTITVRAGKWDETSFFAELEKKRGPQGVEAAKRILEWAREKGMRITWGTGKLYGSLKVVAMHRGKEHRLFFVGTDGTLATWLSAYKPPFDSEAMKLELVRKLNGVGGVSLSNVATGYLSISPDMLENQAALQQILDIYEWVIEEIRKT